MTASSHIPRFSDKLITDIPILDGKNNQAMLWILQEENDERMKSHILSLDNEDFVDKKIVVDLQYLPWGREFAIKQRFGEKRRNFKESRRERNVALDAERDEFGVGNKKFRQAEFGNIPNKDVKEISISDDGENLQFSSYSHENAANLSGAGAKCVFARENTLDGDMEKRNEAGVNTSNTSPVSDTETQASDYGTQAKNIELEASDIERVRKKAQNQENVLTCDEVEALKKKHRELDSDEFWHTTRLKTVEDLVGEEVINEMFGEMNNSTRYSKNDPPTEKERLWGRFFLHFWRE